MLQSKAESFCWDIETKVNISSAKGSGEDEIGTMFFKSGIYDQLQPVLAFDHSQRIIMYTGYIIQAYFTLNYFTKYIDF